MIRGRTVPAAVILLAGFALVGWSAYQTLVVAPLGVCGDPSGRRHAP